MSEKGTRAGRQTDLISNPNCLTFQLCVCGQVMQSRWTSVFSSLKWAQADIPYEGLKRILQDKYCLYADDSNILSPESQACVSSSSLSSFPYRFNRFLKLSSAIGQLWSSFLTLTSNLFLLKSSSFQLITTPGPPVAQVTNFIESTLIFLLYFSLNK